MTRFPTLCVVPLACAAAALPAQPLAPPLDALPTAPSGIVSRPYSPTVGSIRWQRSSDDSGTVAGYEVSRDNVVLGVVDALGYVDHALAPGRSYHYVVRAIDGAGQRSGGAANVFLTTPDLLPPSPTGLRARTYSATAAELVWDRTEVFGTRYEVSRDGDPVALTDGITHVDTHLDPRRAYHFEVVALNRQGERSAPARLMLWTGEGGPPALRAPPIERVAVYSDTAAELFWERPAAGSPVARVEVWRDGEALGVTDGTSFFDDTRSPGVDHRYALVALDTDGRRSDGRVGEGVIRPDNAARVIAAAFDAWRGEPWSRIVRALPGWHPGVLGELSEAQRSVHALPGFSLRPGFPSGGPQTFTCTNGGSATIFYSHPFSAGYGFERCQDGAGLLDGAFGRDLRPGNYLHLFSSTGITLAGPGGTIRYRGYTRDGGRVRGSYGLNTDADPVEFVHTARDGRVLYALRDADTTFYYGVLGRGSFRVVALNGSFSLASARTGGATLSVEGGLWRDTSPPDGWPIPEDWTFTQGSLRIGADDGSALLLEADTGEETTARVSVTSAAGESTVFERPWSVWRENLRFD